MIGKQSTFFKVINSSKEEYGKIKNNISDYYYRKEIDKKNQFGKVKTDENGNPEKRVLFPSRGRIKEIQKLINGRIFSQINFPAEIHGSIKKKSCITNARAHQGNKYFFVTDLRKYFPSIHFKIVYSQLVNLEFSPKVASYLTRLVTFDGCIPQGAPTSSTLANLVFQPYDKKIIEIAKENNLIYTRYIDDLTFSSKKYISNPLIQKLLDVIRESPFRYHNRKTKTGIGITEITGIKIKNNGLDATKEKYRKLNRLETNTSEAVGLKGYIKAVKNA